MNWKKYRRTNIAEMRPVDEETVAYYRCHGELYLGGRDSKVSISDEDRKNGSPKIGDMIARNPGNHADQWLVSKEYFESNFEETGGK